MAGHTPASPPAAAPGNVTPLPVAAPAPGTRAARGGPLPWRIAGIGLTVGTPIGISVASPVLGIIVIAIAMIIALAIAGTALYGSQLLSERGFRMMRWLANRPEPPAPAGPEAVPAQSGQFPR